MMHAAIIRVLFIVVFVITLPENTLNLTISYSVVVRRGCKLSSFCKQKAQGFVYNYSVKHLHYTKNVLKIKN